MNWKPRISMLGAAFFFVVLYFAVEVLSAFRTGGPIDRLKAHEEVRSCAGSATPELQADCMLRNEGDK
jgi:hypothetical protein